MMLQNYFTLSEFDKTKKYVLGFSGGPDSTFLFFHLLNELGHDNFVVAHVNYHLRQESNQAEEIVKKYCLENNVKSFFNEVNFSGKGNLEHWAREERYDFFTRIARENNCDGIIIAHTYNDDMETFILQNNRGNLVSNYGLQKESTRHGLKVIRPMLEIKKDDILIWLNENNIKFDLDKTNNDVKYERNKIRSNFANYDLATLERMKKSKNRMMAWVYSKLEPLWKSEFIIDDFLPLNDKEELVFIFEYLKRFVPNYDIARMKKNITSEVARELRSPKSFIQIKVNHDYSIIKDRTSVFLFKNSDMWITKKIKNVSEIDKFNFKNNDELKQLISVHGELIISNDWLMYQKKLTLQDKSLSKYYKVNKISYRWKLENAVAYREGESNILTKVK